MTSIVEHELRAIPKVARPKRIKRFLWRFLSIVFSLCIMVGFAYWIWSPTTASSSGASVVVTHATPTLAEARATYEQNRDLKSLVLYGRAIDCATTMLDSERVPLERHFYKLLAKEAGAKYKIPWNILYGLWMRESEVNPKAKGDGNKDLKGNTIPGTERAFGLGQIHVPTAQTHMDVNMTKERLMDPIENGFGSAKILHEYTAMFPDAKHPDGNILYGISAYQQGPSATQSQYDRKVLPSNSAYVMVVMQLALEARDD